jgi:hypothetical protein
VEYPRVASAGSLSARYRAKSPGGARTAAVDLVVNARRRPIARMRPALAHREYIRTKRRLYRGVPGFHRRQLAKDGVKLANNNYRHSRDKPFYTPHAALHPPDRCGRCRLSRINVCSRTYAIAGIRYTKMPDDFTRSIGPALRRTAPRRRSRKSLVSVHDLATPRQSGMRSAAQPVLIDPNPR